jgi:nucleotide-binding universal stress UspA family protein
MKILIAIDGSEDANNALEFVLRFPFPRDSSMTVVTVVDDIPLIQAEIDALNEEQSRSLQTARDRLQEDAEEQLERAANRLREDDWAGMTMIRGGSPVQEILSVAKDIDADLIVVGSHGAGLARQFLLGSVSDRILETAPCSVLVVKAGQDSDDQVIIEPGKNAPFRIMLAFDDSDVAHQALNLCSSLPLEQNSEVRVVNVMPLITAYRQDIRQHINSIWLQKKQIMQAELDKAVRSLQWATPNVSTELREGENVSNEVLQAAAEFNCDLLMVGCKDKGAIRRFIAGSITHHLARYANCPVWSARQKNHDA